MEESFARLLVIFNPTANRGKMQRYRDLLQEKLEMQDGEYRETSQRGEAEKLAREAALAGRPLVVVGGDGTVYEVVNGLLAAGRRVPLGIVGAGSGNDYAWNALHLPKDPEQAVERAFSGQLIEVDAGRMGDRYFVNSFSMGLDAEIGATAGRLKKVPFLSGSNLYNVAALKQLLFGYHLCPFLKIHLFDGEQEVALASDRYILIAITNGPAYGAGFRINPRADHLDGYFDVCAVHYAPLLRVLRLLPGVKRGEHEHEPEVRFFRVKWIKVESATPVTYQTDGEAGKARQFRAEVLPGALLVRV